MRLVMRVSADAPVDLTVWAGGREVGTVPVEGGPGWVEPGIDLPEGRGETAISVGVRGRGGAEDDAWFGAFHYWVYAG